jgi:hypothetical protein
MTQEKKEEKHGTDPILVEFVRKFANRGFGPKTLRQYLIAIGKSEAEAEAAVEKVLHEMRHPPRDPAPQNKSTIRPMYVYIGAGAFLVILILAVLAVMWYMNLPVCGNSILEEGEDHESCCEDAGCLLGFSCKNSTCEPIICSACEYLDGDECVPHDCCDDSGCLENESCENNICELIECEYCQFIVNRSCQDYGCCNDTDCNQTDYHCQNHSCVYVAPPVDECQADSDCDDSDVSTTDSCVGESPNKICENTKITDCIEDDEYCPPDCEYPDDLDCDECQYDWECNDTIVMTVDVCQGTPKRCGRYYELCPYGLPGADADCDDGYDATFDYCMRNDTCANVLTTTCTDDDLYCPPGCNSTQDNDCD